MKIIQEYLLYIGVLKAIKSTDSLGIIIKRSCFPLLKKRLLKKGYLASLEEISKVDNYGLLKVEFLRG